MTAARIEQCFAACRAQGRPALIIYLTVGDPSVDDSLACALAALAAGADILELGVPFSDPSADGPVIAAASQRAIRSGGSLRKALEVAGRIREESAAPLVLFSYVNPLIAFGEEQLPKALAAVGVLVLGGAQGFVYYVSSTGVTGLGDAPLAAAAARARAIAGRSSLPVVVGFGVDGPEKAQILARAGVDGVVVGSAIVKAIAAAQGRPARVNAVTALVASLRNALV